MAFNRIVLIGNGFDLAHGLKTSYRNFVDWYMCGAFNVFAHHYYYSDPLFEIKRKPHREPPIYYYQPYPTCIEDVFKLLELNDAQSITYKSNFYKRLIDSFIEGSWVNIEHRYFRLLRSFFENNSSTPNERIAMVQNLNEEFDHIIQKLAEYIQIVNEQIQDSKPLPIDHLVSNLSKAFSEDANSPITFVNFNYTETLNLLGYAQAHEIIHIHGRATDVVSNPIIFGYGDESDPAYQRMEDSGDNMYLEHIKSFGYFKTDNYSKLISLIDSNPYRVYIVGHSCGMSDRILLNEIFEHDNCMSIEIFFHKRQDGSDNFKEITQEISRHFKPQNKKLMRRRVLSKNEMNIIPQISS